MFTGNENKTIFGTILIMVLCLGAVCAADLPPKPPEPNIPVLGPEARDPNPADGAEDVDVDVVLSWTPGLILLPPGAWIEYDVHFDTNSPPAFTDNQTANEYNPGTLEPGTIYYWQINTIVKDAGELWTVYEGNLWSFTTVSGPVEATNPSPADGAEDVPIDVVLSWDTGYGATSHDVYFGTSSPPAFIGNQTASDYEPYGLEPGTTYYWQIDEIEADATINTGDLWSFTTVSGPKEATNPYPADGAKDVPLDVVLEWTSAPGVDWDDVFFGTDRYNVSIAREGSAEHKGAQIFGTYDPGGLEPCTTYYWKIVGSEVIGEPGEEFIVVHEGPVWEFKCIPCLEEFEYGDAPDGGIAYPSTGVLGMLPTCTANGPVVRHGYNPDPEEGAWFGPRVDPENDGNAGLCPGCFPTYDDDEGFMDGDAGLLFPRPYTIQGLLGAERVVNCPGWGGTPLGFVGTIAKWGNSIDIWVENHLPNNEAAVVNVLVDWSQNGLWDDYDHRASKVRAWEHVVRDLTVPNGFVGLLSSCNPPDFLIGPNPGYVWARFTISDFTVGHYWDGEGEFDEGETEDYLLYVAPPPLDFGDAPEAESCQSQFPGYPTKLANNGAHHLIVGGPNAPSGIYLGDGVDADQDGQPNAKATGDDEDWRVGTLNFDDEDGVVFTSGLVLGQTATVDVNANVAGFLDTWVDFGADGSWDEPDDRIFASQPLDAGVNSLTFKVPATGAPNTRTFARFRFSTQGGLSCFGPAANGEVEDYAVFLVKPPVEHLKWSQPPIEWMPTGRTPVYCGWDEPAFRGALEYPGAPVRWYMVADDFRCLGSMPISSVHWWGSYLDWHELYPPQSDDDVEPEAFRIGIWTNVAAGEDPCAPFSHPGRLIWENYCDDYEWNFAGHDRYGQLIADNPTISIGPNSVTGPIPGPREEAEFDWLDWRGWWVRGQSTRIEFTFTGIDTATIPGDQFLVKLNLGVTNHLNGEKGLDGLVLVEIGGPCGPMYVLPNALLDNLDPQNCLHGYQGVGTYETTASILVDKDYIRDGTLTIVVYRNSDLKDTAPAAPVGQCLPIDMSTPIPTVPEGCYDGDDARTVHIHIETTDDTGEVAASGEVTLWVPGHEIENEPVAPSDVRSAKAITETCFQYYVELEPEEYFWQEDYVDDTEDNIFWLSITALYPEGPWPPDYPWGWKTRPWHWMDDAVTFELEPDELKLDLVLDPNVITPIENAQVCEALESYDVAFELDTDPNYIKWEQPYDSVHHWLHHEPELSALTTATEGTIVEPATKWTQRPDLSTGMAVNTTNNQEHFPEMGAQMLADDFACRTTAPLTDISIWGSWCRSGAVFDLGILAADKPDHVTFTLSIHEDIPAPPSPRPANVPMNPHYSRPGKVLWTRQFNADECVVETTLGHAEAYYSPGITFYYDPLRPVESIYRSWDPTPVPIYKYSFHIDPREAFIQQGRANNQVVYWLSVQATPMDETPWGEPVLRFGWMTTPVETHWNDNAVWVWGTVPNIPTWFGPLQYPWEHAELEGKPIDLAFEITDQERKNRIVADDWQCKQRTPVTAAVWWGSYIGYGYEACRCQNMAPPVKPDCFLLSIWTDVPDPNPGDPSTYSHPGEKIWQYKAYNYDEVLLGYDKYPHEEPNEAVFRYSVRIPEPAWFSQENIDEVYWFSVAAVYEGQDEPAYSWGWTNHKHVFNDDAVTGYLDSSGIEPVWKWYELHDQTGRSEDMSFILFTEPHWPIPESAGNHMVDYADLEGMSKE